MKEDRRFHWAWIILVISFLNLFTNYSIRLGYGVVLPEMIRDLGFSRTVGGTILNSYFISYIALTPFAGYLTDRLGARRVITTCVFILGVGVFMMGTVKTLWTACFFFSIAGLGATGMWTPVLTVAQRWFTPKKRGLVLGIISTGYGLGFATMGVAFPWIVDHFNWRYAWYFLGGGALAMVILNGLLLRSTPESAGFLPWGQKEAVSSSGLRKMTRPVIGSFPKLLKDRTFWLIGFSYFCISYSLYGITTYMVDYAKYSMGLSLEKASFLATIHGLCQIIGVLTILPLSDYLGRKKTMVITQFFITSSLLGILFVGNNWIMLYILIGILAVFYGVTFPLYGACAGDYYSREVMGTVIGAWTPLYGTGAILSHWMGGVLRDAMGNYDYAFTINAVMAGIALLLFSRVKKGSNNPL